MFVEELTHTINLPLVTRVNLLPIGVIDDIVVPLKIIFLNYFLHFLFQLNYMVHNLTVLLRYQRFGFYDLIEVLMPRRDSFTALVSVVNWSQYSG